MKRVLVLVEGQTEETFVRKVLDPCVRERGLFLRASIIATRRNPAGRDCTHPSARLRAHIPGYSKLFHGALISGRIGLPAIRKVCRHFDEWVSRLESIS